jgi:thiamine biosynthesis lipoprotein
MSAPVLAEALVEHTFRSMGTEISVLLPTDGADAASLVRATIEEWDERFSRFRPQGELSLLNASVGAPFLASEALFSATEVAIEAARATNGMFDPLLGRRMSELGYDRTFDELDAQMQLAPPTAWIGGRWREVELDARHRMIRLPPGTGLDLGGIAKGMAVDAAVATLRRAGIAYAAVNAGGDLAVHGLPPGMTSWSILIEGAGERMATLHRGALATSTVLKRRWRVGLEARHHLLDPRSGLPATSGLVLASVAAATCAQAEVAAKVALLQGPIGGAAFLRDRGLAGLLVAADGNTQRISAGVEVG